MDETYIKIKGQWKYLYRAVDRDGQTTLRGVELMHMLKTSQMVATSGQKLSVAGQFYSLAA